MENAWKMLTSGTDPGLSFWKAPAHLGNPGVGGTKCQGQLPPGLATLLWCSPPQPTTPEDKNDIQLIQIFPVPGKVNLG